MRLTITFPNRLVDSSSWLSLLRSLSAARWRRLPSYFRGGGECRKFNRFRLDLLPRRKRRNRAFRPISMGIRLSPWGIRGA